MRGNANWQPAYAIPAAVCPSRLTLSLPSLEPEHDLTIGWHVSDQCGIDKVDSKQPAALYAKQALSLSCALDAALHKEYALP